MQKGIIINSSNAAALQQLHTKMFTMLHFVKKRQVAEYATLFALQNLQSFVNFAREKIKEDFIKNSTAEDVEDNTYVKRKTLNVNYSNYLICKLIAVFLNVKISYVFKLVCLYALQNVNNFIVLLNKEAAAEKNEQEIYTIIFNFFNKLEVKNG